MGIESIVEGALQCVCVVYAMIDILCVYMYAVSHR